MSPLLLKIYGLLIVITLVISSTLLRTEKPTPEAIPYPSFVTNKNDFQPQENYISSTSSISNPQNEQVSPSLGNTVIVATTTQPLLQASSSTTMLEIDTPEKNYPSVLGIKDVCTSPIIYTLGVFDSRFGISKNYFLETVNNSANLWNKASGKTLFIYDEKNGQQDITINLIYDKRQAMTDDNKFLGAEIENTKNAASALEKEYEGMKIVFTKLKDEYVADVDAFNIRQKVYSDSVTSWNEKGGAPRPEYDALNLEKEYLTKTAATIAQKHETLTVMLADIDAKITRHNELVVFANEKIKQNNLIAHTKFTEGNYNPATRKVSIYQFTDNIKLQRVLTHELGHALGILEHTKDKQSIMYAVNSASNTSLTPEDIRALKKICP